MQIKPYPQPDEAKGLSSRFSKGFKTVDGAPVEIFGEAQPFYTETKFVYDAETKTGRFEAAQDAAGNDIKGAGRSIPPYLPGTELIELVRLAQILQRPILIKGEPGSGKTQLAKAVAYEWYGDDYRQHFFEWPVKSTSKAVDGLYTFDHIARLRNAQLAKSSGQQTAEKEDLTQYRSFGPMGMAFLTSTAANPSILLIDEIDKADIDFPNDLLLELDERRFKIPDSETGEEITAHYPPLIFITSNDERELPEAFLRRCLFLYIKFPPPERLKDIIRSHLPQLVDGHEAFVTAAIGRFMQLRKEIEEDPSDNKRVSTSELIDWLRGYDFDLKDETRKPQLENQSLDEIPFYHQALLKTFAAVHRRELQSSDLKKTKNV